MVDGKHLVFIIDDDSAVRTGLSRLIRSAGYSTEVFASAEEYLEREQYQGNACMIVDVMMPGITGPMLQKRLIDRGSHFPIIFLTARGSFSSCVKAIKRGAMDYFQKPVDETILLDAVDKALKRARPGDGSQFSPVQPRTPEACLTSRELAILRFILDGSSNRQIADYFQISNHSVVACRQRIRQKTGEWPVAEGFDHMGMKT